MSIREHLERIEEAGTDNILGNRYKQEIPMSGADIAKELGVTRQAVSNTLKRAMEKVFKEMKKLNKGMDAFEVAVGMAVGWDAANTTAEMQKFFTLFPPKIRKEIEAAAAKRMSGVKK